MYSFVNNNSFSTALTSRRPITLDDIEPSHREDVWRLLGLLPGGDRGVKKVDPLQHKGPSRTNNGQASTGLGATKSLEGGAASTRARGGLMRDMSVDLTRDSSPVSSLTSTPLKQDALKEAQGKEEEGGGQWAHGSLPAASLTPLEGSAVSNHKHGVRRHHQLVSYTSLPFDGAGGGRLGGGIGSLALDPTFSPASLLCVPVACPGKETLAVLACLVDKTSEMEFDQEDVLTVQECFKYTIGMLVNTLTAEREHRLRTQCQALLNVAQNLFTHLDDVTVLLREVMAEARKLTDAERCSSSSWTRTTISWLTWRKS
ncbi:putative cGMP-dependent 3 [Penaeus vannamei]|uniref:Putative cGMP-dependent 3 n=1 Tax=Penaeus vannamei TaxID=6689 RepID=A0A3R7NUS5_PENVA|nr:putative cGMP-dependent 3 [Penaeus vannamei]